MRTTTCAEPRRRMQLLAVVVLHVLGQVGAGPIRWTANPKRCLSVSESVIILSDCGDGEGPNEQFTTTAMGPIHWATHPGKCIFVDVSKGNLVTLEDCVDVVNNPAAQFIAMQNGLMCLEDHADKCIRAVGEQGLRALECNPAEKACSFNPVDAIRRYSRSQGFVDGGFFSRFTFFNNSDPTHGKVDYVTEDTAKAEGFIHEANGKVYIGADVKTKTGGKGRRSIRIESKAVWREGLFVVSFEHLPTGCGTWPAMWLLGENKDHPWPSWGEYDIIEGTHEDNRVSTTLHTGVGCSQQNVPHDFSGHWQMGIDRKSTNCDIGAPGQYGNQGCGQLGPEGSLGEQFNKRGGGTYAAEWDPEAGYIRTWFWKHGEEPLDIRQGEPDPGRWDQPYSFFRLGDMCPASHFRDMRLIFDLTFCGDLGNPTFAKGCPAHAAKMTCEELVSNHPEYLQGAFWSIRTLDVYTLQRPKVVSSTVPPSNLPRPPPLQPARPPTQTPVGSPPVTPWDGTPATQPPEVAPPITVQLLPDAVGPQGPFPVSDKTGPRADEAEVTFAGAPIQGVQKEKQGSSFPRWIIFVLMGMAALCFVGALGLGAAHAEDLPRAVHFANGEIGTGTGSEDGKEVDGTQSEGLDCWGWMSALFSRMMQLLSPFLLEAAASTTSLAVQLYQHPVVQQLIAALDTAWCALSALWAKWAPASLQSSCSTAYRALRGQYDSMWQAVSAMDSTDEVGLRKGDQVVVKSPFIAESGTIFGTRLQKNMKGLVEEVHTDGGVLVQFAGHLGRFPVRIPLELQSHLQVESADAIDDPKVMAPFCKNRAAEWVLDHRRAILGLGASCLLVSVMISIFRTGGSEASGCTQQYLDCRESLKCCDPMHACFEKTDQWAACLPNCTQGVHYDEEPQWRSPWTCRVIAPARGGARGLLDSAADAVSKPGGPRGLLDSAADAVSKPG